MPLVHIDRNGDLTLQLTKNINEGSEDRTRSIVVSAKVLALASPVFAVMLGPHFREGQRSSSGSLDPIPLPDDDAEAMTMLCHIFHFNYSALPPKIDLDLFKELALLCDKYDCVAPLKFISEQWLLTWEEAVKEDQLELLLFISYIFDRPERFSALTAKIIRQYSGSLKHLKTLRRFDAIPEQLFKALNRQRKATLKGVDAALAHQLEQLDQPNSQNFSTPSELRLCTQCLRAVSSSFCMKCKVATIPAICSRDTRHAAYIRILKGAGLNPVGLWSLMTKKSIDDITSSMLVVDDEVKHHACGGTTNCPLGSAFSHLRMDIDSLVSKTRGLCLDCINAERETTGLNMLPSGKTDCRVNHDQNRLVIIKCLY